MWLIGSKREEGKGIKCMVDSIVIDASVALKWQFRDEVETGQAIKILSDFVDGKIELISPTLFAYEIVNAIHIAVVRKRISEKEGRAAVNDILAMEIKLHDFAELAGSTFNLAQGYKISAYDSAYLSLAVKQGCVMYTADRHLFNALQSKITPIRWVGDYTVK